MVIKQSPILGCLCLICRNVYTTIGYASKYGTTNKFQKYKALMATTAGAEVHKKFLMAEKAWITLCNSDGEGSSKKTTLKEVDVLNEVERMLSVERQHMSGFKNRKKEFVEKDHWDTKKDGEYNTANEFSKEIFGAMRKGCYVWRGREGVEVVCEVAELTCSALRKKYNGHVMGLMGTYAHHLV